jgi:phenylpyruvate tautomerase PptA (4-oxalocrotonate tautomerase family)
MPLIIVEVLEGTFTPEQQSTISARLTTAMAALTRENVWCVVDEVRSNEWAVTALTAPQPGSTDHRWIEAQPA